jgi:hypothetical protein
MRLAGLLFEMASPARAFAFRLPVVDQWCAARPAGALQCVAFSRYFKGEEDDDFAFLVLFLYRWASQRSQMIGSRVGSAAVWSHVSCGRHLLFAFSK